MAIEFNCPNCNAIIRVPDNAAGGKGRCPRCSTRIKVPKTSMPRAAKKNDDPELDFFAASEQEAAAPAPVKFGAANTAVSTEPVELEPVELEPADFESELNDDPFAIKPRALGEFPVADAPRRPLKPDSISSSLKRKKDSSGGWVVAAAFGLILCGAFGWFYWQQQQGYRLVGELTAESAPVLDLKPVEVSSSMFRRSPDEMKTYVEELQKNTVRFPSRLMLVQIGASNKGVTVSVNAGTTTHFFRVDVHNDPALMRYRSEHGVELEEIRAAEVKEGGSEFLTEYQRYLDKESKSLNDYRDSFALPSLVRGLGWQVQAVVNQTEYRCVYEDHEGALYFLLPGEPTEFEIVGRKQKDGKVLFPGKYLVKVTGEMKEATREKVDSKSKKSGPEKEAPGLSEMGNDSEMKEMKGEMDESEMKDGEMKMEEKPKKKKTGTSK